MKTCGRESMLVNMDRLDAFTLGALIAMFERIIGFYAVHLGINPYDQPQVEEGKKRAAGVIDIKKRLTAYMEGAGKTVDAVAVKAAFEPGEYHILYYLLLQMRQRGQISNELKELDKLLN